MMVDEPTMEVEEIPHENIDEHEHDDPQAVTTYVEEIYENNRLREVSFLFALLLDEVAQVNFISTENL